MNENDGLAPSTKPTMDEENAENVKVLHNKLAVRTTNQLLYLAKLLKAIPEIVEELGPAGEVEVYMDTLNRQKAEKEAELRAVQHEIDSLEQVREEKLAAATKEAELRIRNLTRVVTDERGVVTREREALEAKQQQLFGEKGTLTTEIATLQAQAAAKRAEVNDLTAQSVALVAKNKAAQAELERVQGAIRTTLGRLTTPVLAGHEGEVENSHG